MISEDGIRLILTAITEYDGSESNYDEVFLQVQANIAANGCAGKVDIAAITFWKRSAQGAWIRELLSVPEADVQATTRRAFEAVDDRAALKALSVLPGFRSQGPLATALLTAHDSDNFAVMDRRAFTGLGRLGIEMARGTGETLRYLSTVRQLRTAASRLRPDITTRDIDKGLYILGYTERAPGTAPRPRRSSTTDELVQLEVKMS
jgi:hypothetical protein